MNLNMLKFENIYGILNLNRLYIILTLPVQSSAKMHPRDQISIFLSYESPRITSGAR